MGKFDGEVVVITCGSTGLALAGATVFDEATKAAIESLIRPAEIWAAPKVSDGGTTAI